MCSTRTKSFLVSFIGGAKYCTLQCCIVLYSAVLCQKFYKSKLILKWTRGWLRAEVQYFPWAAYFAVLKRPLIINWRTHSFISHSGPMISVRLPKRYWRLFSNWNVTGKKSFHISRQQAASNSVSLCWFHLLSPSLKILVLSLTPVWTYEHHVKILAQSCLIQMRNTAKVKLAPQSQDFENVPMLLLAQTLTTAMPSSLQPIGAIPSPTSFEFDA